MNVRHIVSAALLGTLVSSAAFAAGNASGSQLSSPPVANHATRQTAKLAPPLERQCSALEARFDKALAAWTSGDRHRLADAKALRREGGSFCQQGNNRAAVKYLEGAINTLAGKHVV